MPSDVQLFQIVGIGLMLIGAAAVLFGKKGEGAFELEGLGGKINVSAPSLAIFVGGAVLFTLPFTALFKDRSSENVAAATINNAVQDDAFSNVSLDSFALDNMSLGADDVVPNPSADRNSIIADQGATLVDRPADHAPSVSEATPRKSDSAPQKAMPAAVEEDEPITLVTPKSEAQSLDELVNRVVAGERR